MRACVRVRACDRALTHDLCNRSVYCLSIDGVSCVAAIERPGKVLDAAAKRNDGRDERDDCRNFAECGSAGQSEASRTTHPDANRAVFIRTFKHMKLVSTE